MQELLKIVQDEYNSRLRYQLALLAIFNSIVFIAGISMKPSVDISYVCIVLIGMFNVWYLRNME